MTVRRVGALGAVFLSAVLLAGCGSDEAAPVEAFEQVTTPADDGTTFTAAQVERMITRSTEPTLAASLGEGSTMEVDCGSGAGSQFRCDVELYPGGDTVSPVRTVYRVECRARTCQWFPIG